MKKREDEDFRGDYFMASDVEVFPGYFEEGDDPDKYSDEVREHPEEYGYNVKETNYSDPDWFLNYNEDMFDECYGCEDEDVFPQCVKDCTKISDEDRKNFSEE